MTAKQEFLVEGIVSDMAKWLMEERSVSLQEALGLIYNSQTFEKYRTLLQAYIAKVLPTTTIFLSLN